MSDLLCNFIVWVLSSEILRKIKMYLCYHKCLSWMRIHDFTHYVVTWERSHSICGSTNPVFTRVEKEEHSKVIVCWMTDRYIYIYICHWVSLLFNMVYSCAYPGCLYLFKPKRFLPLGKNFTFPMWLCNVWSNGRIAELVCKTRDCGCGKWLIGSLEKRLIPRQLEMCRALWICIETAIWIFNPFVLEFFYLSNVFY